MFCNSGSWFHVIHVLSRFQQLHNVPSPLSNMKTSLEQWQNPLLLDWQEHPSGMVGLECHGWCGGGGWFMLLPPFPPPCPQETHPGWAPGLILDSTRCWGEAPHMFLSGQVWWLRFCLAGQNLQLWDAGEGSQIRIFLGPCFASFTLWRIPLPSLCTGAAGG